MIKLSRPDAPEELTTDVVQSLTREFLEDKSKNVWHKNYIRDGLSRMSNSKCAYCETILDEEAKYLEVEHFKNKGDYPDLVVVWDNLLPSCKHCNVSKGVHDVVAEPIVDPSVVDPRDYLSFKNYRFEGKCPVGESTIEVIDLNDHQRYVRKRFQVGDAIYESINRLSEALEKYTEDISSVRRKNKLLSQMRSILRESHPTAEYSATSATILTQSMKFNYVKRELENLGLWDAELKRNYQEVLRISF